MKFASVALVLLVLSTGCRKVVPDISADLSRSAECDRMTYYAVQVAREERPRIVGAIVRSVCGQLIANRSRRDIANSLGIASDANGRDLPLKCSLFQFAEARLSDTGRVGAVSIVLRDDVATVHQLREVLGGSVEMEHHGGVRDGCSETVARFTLPLDASTRCVIDAKPERKRCWPRSIEDEPVGAIVVSLR